MFIPEISNNMFVETYNIQIFDTLPWITMINDKNNDGRFKIHGTLSEEFKSIANLQKKLNDAIEIGEQLKYPFITRLCCGNPPGTLNNKK